MFKELIGIYFINHMNMISLLESSHDVFFIIQRVYHDNDFEWLMPELYFAPGENYA